MGDADGARESQLDYARALVVFDGVEGRCSSSIVTPGLGAAEGSFGLPVLHGTKEHHMFATIRRYEGVDQNRSAELTRKVNESLLPKLNKVPGFEGYYLIEAGNGVFSSLSLFETPEQGMDSTKIVATWLRDEKLDTVIPNEPKITSGKVVVRSDRVLVAA
ncbi:MAG TPA: hypothetical protein VHR46_00940 [Gaiella sp.]|nr:hypothetical protein [Gaiella sp.]